jgi:hypothetical protein
MFEPDWPSRLGEKGGTTHGFDQKSDFHKKSTFVTVYGIFKRNINSFWTFYL